MCFNVHLVDPHRCAVFEVIKKTPPTSTTEQQKLLEWLKVKRATPCGSKPRAQRQGSTGRVKVCQLSDGQVASPSRHSGELDP